MKNRVSRIVLGIMIVCTAAALQAGQPATKSGKKAAAKKPVEKRTAQDAVTPAVKNPERHEQFLARIKQGPVDLLFLGDSITDAWPRAGKDSWEKFAKYNPADFGISGDRTEHVLWRITHGELDGIKPKATVLMIGTNNIGHFGDEEPEWAAAGVKKIIETVHAKLPETKVLLLAVFPRDRKDSPNRTKVDAINRIISKFGDGKKTVFLDVNHVFLDADGAIPKEIMPDGLHPNAKGYDLWYEAMLPTLEKLMKE